MSVIQNKWTKKENPKPKAKSKPKDPPKYVPTLIKSNMQRTLRGVRK